MPKIHKFKGPDALLDLAGQLREIVRDQIPAAKIVILEQVGNAVALEARDRLIGRLTPLEQTGPFNAWAPLKQATIDRKEKKGWGKNGNPASMLYATGKYADSVTYEVFARRGRSEVHIGTMYEIAKYLEYGTIHMGPRPVFGPAMIRTLPRLIPRIETLLTRTISGDGPRW